MRSKAGKHQIIEKPVALGLAGLQRLRAAVDATGVKTIVSFALRWNPLFQVIRSLLGSGTACALFYAAVGYSVAHHDVP
jgi:predicted dehydrogenase